MKIGIVVVPYITTDEQWDLMTKSIKSFKSIHTLQIYGVVNCCRDEDLLKLRDIFPHLTINNENILARAWNTGVRQAMADGCDYIFIPNLDVEFDDKTIDNLVEFAETKPECTLFSSYCINGVQFELNSENFYEVNYETMLDSFSCFMMRKNHPTEMYKKEYMTKEPYPGMFDENIKPAYCEDQDYQIRVQRRGLKHYCFGGSTYIHFRNGTRKLHANKQWAEENLNESKATPYMIKKWNGIRGDAKYIYPFIA